MRRAIAITTALVTFTALISFVASAGELSATDLEYYAAWGISADDPDLHQKYGDLLVRSGDVDGGRASFDRALVLDPKHAGAHDSLGDLLLAQDPATALEHYLAAIATRKEGSHGRSYSGAGMALGMMGRRDEALVQFEKAVTINGNNSQIRFNLGVSLAAHSRFVDAIIQLAKAVELDPELDIARRRLASVLATQQRFTEALPHYETLAARLPNNAGVLRSYARVLQNLGEDEKASAVLTRARSLP